MVRASSRLLLLALGLLPLWAPAAPQSVVKAQERRAEARRLAQQIADGEGNVLSAIARVEFLDERDYASGVLVGYWSTAVDPRQRRNLAMALAQWARPNAEPALLKALSDDDGAVRMYGAQGAGRLRSRAAGPTLAALLGDHTLGVRREAAKALGTLRDPRFGAALLRAGKAEGEVEVRAAMLAAAGQSGDKRQAAGLEEFLTSSSEATRFGAAQGLCNLGSPKGYAFARALIAKTDRYERIAGLKLFEGVPRKEAAPVLEPLLVDPDAAVAAMAARILYQGGDAGKLAWLVLRSHRAASIEEKLLVEKELELLRLADDQRKAILAKAGVK